MSVLTNIQNIHILEISFSQASFELCGTLCFCTNFSHFYLAICAKECNSCFHTHFLKDLGKLDMLSEEVSFMNHIPLLFFVCALVLLKVDACIR